MVSAPEKSQPGRRSSRAPAAILRATEAILLEEGVEGVTIRKVAERSGYTAPTLYHHFGDKQGLMRALLEERFRDVYEVMRSIPAGDDPAVHLREMARAFVEFALANPDHYRLLTTPHLEDADAVPSAEAARGLVKQGLMALEREGTLGGDVEAAFQVTWAMLHGLVSLQLVRPDYDFSPDLTELALDVVDGGLLRRNVR